MLLLSIRRKCFALGYVDMYDAFIDATNAPETQLNQAKSYNVDPDALLFMTYPLKWASTTSLPTLKCSYRKDVSMLLWRCKTRAELLPRCQIVATANSCHWTAGLYHNSKPS